MVILILLLLFETTIPCVNALNTPTYFAKIMYEEVYLYKKPIDNDSCENIYFTLPKTYYVLLTGNENEMFYQANYLDFCGYVKKESVQAVAGTPNQPYLKNINFRIYADMSRQLMSEPNISSITSTQIASIPLYARNIKYYGKILGETLIDGRTNIWYFCKYTADKDYYGYVYSDFCDEIPNPLPMNTENFTFIHNPNFELNVTTSQTIPIKDHSVKIIVFILCIPALIVAFMIIKIATTSLPHEGKIPHFS